MRQKAACTHPLSRGRGLGRGHTRMGSGKFKDRAWRIAAIPTLKKQPAPEFALRPKPSPQPSPSEEGADCRSRAIGCTSPKSSLHFLNLEVQAAFSFAKPHCRYGSVRSFAVRQLRIFGRNVNNIIVLHHRANIPLQTPVFPSQKRAAEQKAVFPARGQHGDFK